ncbi:MAG: excinuclease ABC subunit UvrC [Spirochaetales bacterium]|nr:excinuclease ABC subunit UvrC [Spirochaetales bacterium]
MAVKSEILLKIDKLPDASGVYLFKNDKKKIIYVGKAKSLRKRVRSYFSGERDIKTKLLTEHIMDLDFILTRNQHEALLLEINLIKQWKPRFNINLKDGKSYPVIRITNEAFPRVFKTRRIFFDGSQYFGPFPNAYRVADYMNLIEKLFPLRKCKGQLKKKNQPCLYYHIKRCTAPCCGKVTQEDYNEVVDKIRDLLSGKINKLLENFTKSMEAASAELNYEKAAIIRDDIKLLREFNEYQQVVDFHKEETDYVGIYTTGNLCTFAVLKHQGGKAVGQSVFHSELYSSSADAMSQFVAQFYHDQSKVPKIIYLSQEIEAESLAKALRELTGHKLNLKIPQRGQHLKILDTAVAAAKEYHEIQVLSRKQKNGLTELQKHLELKKLPIRIEGFDISHLGGEDTVASMVSFYNGYPDKPQYRYFKIRSLAPGKIDDYESIREAVARRYTRVLNEGLKAPDLILIDGGRGQVNAAKGILDKIGFSHIPLIGLAKAEEEIIIPGREDSVKLEAGNKALLVIQAVRDESHRFANSLRKRLKKKTITHSILEKVKGIGEVKAAQLLQKFGSLHAILNSDLETLQREAGINEVVAQELLAFLAKTNLQDYREVK